MKIETILKRKENLILYTFTGDNNLRRVKEDPEDYLKLIKKLLNEITNIPKCHLVLTSLLPSLETNHLCKYVFKEVSESIKNITLKYGPERASFINLNKAFLHAGKIKYELYEDGVHLNTAGAKELASRIVNHLKYIPKMK